MWFSFRCAGPVDAATYYFKAGSRFTFDFQTTALPWRHLVKEQFMNYSLDIAHAYVFHFRKIRNLKQELINKYLSL